MRATNCKCGHLNEIQTLNNRISFLEKKILYLETNKTSDRRGASFASAVSNRPPATYIDAVVRAHLLSRQAVVSGRPI